MLNIGDVVDGKYKVIRQLGQGGMSTVYLSINESVNKLWAIKEVRKDKDDIIGQKGLTAEIEVLKSLNHNNMPSIIDIIDNGEESLIVMDYIEGKALSKILNEYGAQPQESVIKWGKQLCDVLGYLHARGIIYRDMKPSNVMLQPNGDIVLIDFGTARKFKGYKLEDTISFGTVGYAAPEQYTGTAESDARTDIYALGGTLYHLVTGTYPNPAEMKPIRQINPNLSEGLEKIILKCTRQEADLRYQNCEELMYDLEHCQEQDKKYRRKETTKMAVFSATLAVSIVGLSVGMIGNHLAVKKTQEQYDTILEKAEKENFEKKYKSYIQAIKIKPDDEKAYLELINKIYKNDEVFSRDEMNELEEIMIQNSSKLKINEEDYSTVCYNIGILYWYYCDASMEDDNSRLDAVCNYFAKVSDKDSNKKLADIFYSMADFRRSIQNSIKESTDHGLYAEYWQSIKNLIDIIQEMNVNSNVKLNSCKVAINAIEGYASEFKDDGIEKKDINNYVNIIRNIVTNAKENDGQGIEELKEYITKRYADLDRKIDIVYKQEDK